MILCLLLLGIGLAGLQAQQRIKVKRLPIDTYEEVGEDEEDFEEPTGADFGTARTGETTDTDEPSSADAEDKEGEDSGTKPVGGCPANTGGANGRMASTEDCEGCNSSPNGSEVITFNKVNNFDVCNSNVTFTANLRNYDATIEASNIRWEGAAVGTGTSINVDLSKNSEKYLQAFICDKSAARVTISTKECSCNSNLNGSEVISFDKVNNFDVCNSNVTFKASLLNYDASIEASDIRWEGAAVGTGASITVDLNKNSEKYLQAFICDKPVSYAGITMKECSCNSNLSGSEVISFDKANNFDVCDGSVTFTASLLNYDASIDPSDIRWIGAAEGTGTSITVDLNKDSEKYLQALVCDKPTAFANIITEECSCNASLNGSEVISFDKANNFDVCDGSVTFTASLLNYDASIDPSDIRWEGAAEGTGASISVEVNKNSEKRLQAFVCDKSASYASISTQECSCNYTLKGNETISFNKTNSFDVCNSNVTFTASLLNYEASTDPSDIRWEGAAEGTGASITVDLNKNSPKYLQAFICGNPVSTAYIKTVGCECDKKPNRKEQMSFDRGNSFSICGDDEITFKATLSKYDASLDVSNIRWGGAAEGTGASVDVTIDKDSPKYIQAFICDKSASVVSLKMLGCIECEGDDLDKKCPKDLEPSDKLKTFMHEWEEFSPILYDSDGSNNCTIGYGHLVHTGKCNGKDARETPYLNKVMKKTEAETLYLKDLYDKGTKYVRIRLAGCKYKLTQAEFDALVDYSYNAGSTSLKTITDVIKSGASKEAIADKIRTTKNKEAGNKNRRRQNADMFTNCNYDSTH